jgi:hypothetical protein
VKAATNKTNDTDGEGVNLGVRWLGLKRSKYNFENTGVPKCNLGTSWRGERGAASPWPSPAMGERGIGQTRDLMDAMDEMELMDETLPVGLG